MSGSSRGSTYAHDKPMARDDACLNQALSEDEGLETRLARIRAMMANLQWVGRRGGADSLRLAGLIDGCGGHIREIHARCQRTDARKEWFCGFDADAVVVRLPKQDGLLMGGIACRVFWP